MTLSMPSAAQLLLGQRIKELEAELATATESVANLTRLNGELTDKLSDAETRNKKLRRSSKRDESSLKEQLAIAQSKRG